MVKTISDMLALASVLALTATMSHAENALENRALENNALETQAVSSLNAQFETTECARPCKQPVKYGWWMWRTPEQVELRKADAHNSELWTRAAGKTYYAFLMHDEKKVIEYAEVDLKMLNHSIDAQKWEALTTLVTQKDLTGLKKKSLKQQYQGLSLVQYDGKLNGVETHITWVPALQIPLKLTYVYPKQQLTVKLVQHGAQAAAMMATTEQTLLGYDRIDYTDIGDMEHAASAKVWLAKAAKAPGLQSHQH